MRGMVLCKRRARIVGIGVSASGLSTLNVSPASVVNVLRGRGVRIGAKSVTARVCRLHLHARKACADLRSVRGRLVVDGSKQRTHLKSVTAIRHKCCSPPSALVQIGNGHTVNVNITDKTGSGIMTINGTISRELTRVRRLLPVNVRLASLCPRSGVTSRTGGNFVLGLVRSLIVIVLVVFIIVKSHTNVLVNDSLLFSMNNALLVVLV